MDASFFMSATCHLEKIKKAGTEIAGYLRIMRLQF